MNIASSYSVASNYSGYNAQKTSQTSSKTFTIPTEYPKNEATMLGPLTFQRSDKKYDPFKDIAETGNVNFPKHLQTKTTPTRSDEEILKDIAELAKKHAKTGVQKCEDDDRFVELLDEYISSVSPDRAGILKNAVTEIHDRLNQDDGYSISSAFLQIQSQITQKEDEKEKDEKELIDYLLEAFKNKGKGKGGNGGTISSITENGPYRTVEVDHGGGMSTISHYAYGELTSVDLKGNNYYAGLGGTDNSSAVSSAQFFDDNGNKIMDYYSNDPSGLRQKYTEEEGKRLQEIVGIYNANYDFVLGNEKRKGYNDETYNSTYDRLRNEAVA